MGFDKHKKDILEKTDKSKKGAVDERIKELCVLINQSNDYFTSSSCSGRVMLLKTSRNNKKNEAEWVFVAHEHAVPEDVKSALDSYACNDVLMFKQESAILHIGARTIEHAQKMIDIAKESGFKRSGIFSTRKKIFVELICAEGLSAPVFDGKKLVDDSYLEYLVSMANKKMDVSWNAIERLKKALSRDVSIIK
ncbi:MAG: tRNA wybutosine-synthesizing 3 family protein [Candidatus Woesearchaeota archaeon]